MQSSPLLWITRSQKGFLATTRPQWRLEITEWCIFHILHYLVVEYYLIFSHAIPVFQWVKYCFKVRWSPGQHWLILLLFRKCLAHVKCLHVGAQWKVPSVQILATTIPHPPVICLFTLIYCPFFISTLQRAPPMCNYTSSFVSIRCPCLPEPLMNRKEEKKQPRSLYLM